MILIFKSWAPPSTNVYGVGPGMASLSPLPISLIILVKLSQNSPFNLMGKKAEIRENVHNIIFFAMNRPLFCFVFFSNKKIHLIFFEMF